MIVGASPGTDFEILSKAWSLYSAYDLRRVYYSAFSPIPGAHPLLPTAAPPLVRENRLYQADWLLRFYGFSVEELATPVAPDLPLDRDPKLDWALRNREFFPIDVNRAARRMLLRVPGLGVRTVDRILKVRRYRAIRFADLAKLQVPLTKARPFVITADRNPAAHLIDSAPARQLDLFATS
jgi:predicted DNA-binding helix-hairpin-helix protein